MKAKILALVAVVVASVVAGNAEARGSASGVMLTGNAFIYNSTDDNNGTKIESKNSIYDIKLGYLTGSGLYLGGIYTLRNSQTGSTTTDGKALGGSVGYVAANGFFVMGHYIASAELGDLKEGKGMQGDLGYLTNVTGAFVVGVELTYRSIEYKTTSDTKYKKDELLPLLTLGFVF
ncbi:hypothetical protein [uncultured Bdellovibrio sp.]|uniref:hypothetical protein n=1 Tax=Bdellovibrio sp. HCB-162 TaxID=3394234 RepID=UPI0025E5C314|nr:hypothetical protein [uncultured Bdellovibrio sp.]